MSEASDTPETDAEAMDGEYRYQGSTITLHEWDYRKTPDGDVVPADFARQLERERNEKIADIQKAADEIDRWRKLARRENERALSLEEECNGLRARVAELEGELKDVTEKRNTVLQRLLEKSK